MLFYFLHSVARQFVAWPKHRPMILHCQMLELGTQGLLLLWHHTERSSLHKIIVSKDLIKNHVIYCHTFFCFFLCILPYTDKLFWLKFSFNITHYKHLIASLLQGQLFTMTSGFHNKCSHRFTTLAPVKFIWAKSDPKHCTVVNCLTAVNLLHMIKERTSKATS